MRQYSIFLLALIFCMQAESNMALKELQKMLGRRQAYHTVIVNGKIVSRGEFNMTPEHCNLRYNIMKPIMDKYSRSFTLLDIGSAAGYFAIRSAADFDCTAVMMEQNYQPLQKICEANTDLNNLVFLNTRCDVKMLRCLGDCEHFDVIMALNVIHHFEEKWEACLDALMKLGDNLLIETPVKTTTGSVIGSKYLTQLNNAIQKRGGVILGEVPRWSSPKDPARIYHVKCPSKKLRYTRYDTVNPSAARNYPIESNYEEKFMHKKGQKLEWLKGMNLWTFKILNGTFPSTPVLKKSVLDVFKDDYKDFMIWNLILQGNEVKVIDQDEDWHPSARGLKDTLKALEVKPKPGSAINFY
ncbi:MAG TPA: hypothetical protein QGF02_04055 [Candidatus Babeliales bacterium]|nr:hypothetical protein [Candidatus Babeliales bacterium]